MMNEMIGLKSIEAYDAEIAEIAIELETLPVGSLYRRGSRYYHWDGASERGITENSEIIRQLARKAYLSQRLENLEHNRSIVEKLLTRLKPDDPAEIISSLTSTFQNLPVQCFFHPSAQHQEPPNSTAGFQDELKYQTDSGVRVRSKSERTIANMLSRFNIPYQYEAALEVAGEVWHPDFIIRRPFDGKLFVWEHFGLMDDEDYRRKVTRKLELYFQFGFYPFDNLICTYEEDLHDTSFIESLVEYFFRG